MSRGLLLAVTALVAWLVLALVAADSPQLVPAAAASRVGGAFHPGACLEGRQRRCTVCHQDTGPWGDSRRILIDIIDPETGASFAREDGTFLIAVRRGGERRVQTVFGADATWVPRPALVGWLYVDPEQLRTAPESSPKFAPGWEANRPLCCKRLVEGPPTERHAGNACATLTMTLRPLADARDGEVELQCLFKSMDQTLVGNYYERRVLLRVQE